MKIKIIIIAQTIFLSACSYVAVEMAPKKQEVSQRSVAAINADDLFWKILHDGEYEKIPVVLEPMTAAYLETPNDSITAAHIGWLHIWRLAERARLEKIPATITDDATLALKYFQEAVSLNPSDARFFGFFASSMMVEGSLNKDEKQIRKAYFALHEAIDAWPEFNLFTAGYMLSQKPSGSTQFQEGLALEWRNLDECVAEKIDRENPDYSKFMSLSSAAGKKRACWNSWIAPHNLEGFFLNMGDMLVKSGDWKTAKIIYRNAKLSKDYLNWKFQDVLDDRIKNAEDNVLVFNDSLNKNPKEKIMFESSFNCMACHQD